MPNIKNANIDKIYTMAAEQGISLSFLCSAIGKQRYFLTGIKRGKGYIDDRELAVIAEKLHTTVEYLTDKISDPALLVKPVQVDKSPNVKSANVERIKALAKSKGITMSFLCKQINKHRNFLACVRLGQDYIDQNELQVIADILGTTTDYLANNVDDPALPLQPVQANKSPCVNIDKIYTLAAEQGISLSFLCRAVGRPQYFLTDVARKKSSIDERELSIIAEKLHTTTEYLIDKTDDPALPEKTKQKEMSAERSGFELEKELKEMLIKLSPAQQLQVKAFIAGLKTKYEW